MFAKWFANKGEELMDAGMESEGLKGFALCFIGGCCTAASEFFWVWGLFTYIGVIILTKMGYRITKKED